MSQNIIHLPHETLMHKMCEVARLEPLVWSKHSALPERNRGSGKKRIMGHSETLTQVFDTYKEYLKSNASLLGV